MRHDHATVRTRLSREGGVIAATALVLSVGCGGAETPRASGESVAPLAVTAMPASLPALPSVPDAVSIPAPEALVLADEGQVRAAWKEAVSFVEARDFGSALPLLEAVAVERSDDAGVFYVLGIARWKTGNVEGAEGALAKSVEIDPDRFKGWLNLARVRMEAGLHETALEAASRAVERDAGSADARHQAGRALYALGRVDEAVEMLGTGRELDPANGHLANTLGWVLIREGRVHDAVQPLEAAKQALPGVAYVRNNLGVAYERTGRREEAIEEYRAAVEAGDSDGKAAVSLARM